MTRLPRLFALFLIAVLVTATSHAAEVVGGFLTPEGVDKVVADRRIAAVTENKLLECDLGTIQLQKQIELAVKETAIYKRAGEDCNVAGEAKDKAIENLTRLSEEKQAEITKLKNDETSWTVKLLILGGAFVLGFAGGVAIAK